MGGMNEPIPNVSITVLHVGVFQVPTVYITDEYGQVCIPFEAGEIYDVTIVYKDVEKNVRLRYGGEAVLLISIDPYKPYVGEVVFLSPQPVDKPIFVMSIENLVWFAFGVIVSLIGSIIYYRWRGRKRNV
jgi:hypothetical protein